MCLGSRAVRPAGLFVVARTGFPTRAGALRRLKQRDAAHGRSMEVAVRAILTAAVDRGDLAPAGVRTAWELPEGAAPTGRTAVSHDALSGPTPLGAARGLSSPSPPRALAGERGGRQWHSH